MALFRIKFAINTLKSGGVIAYPTESIFGLGCDPNNPKAVTKLLKLKQRLAKKGLILIGSKAEHFDQYIQKEFRSLAQKKLKESTQLPTTWVIPADKNVPKQIIGSHDKIALRLTSHPIAAMLCSEFGNAIVSTSANINKRAAAKNSLQVNKYFSNKLDYIFYGQTQQYNIPSQIIDMMTGNIIR